MGLGLSAKPSLAAVARAGKSQLFFRCKPSAQFEQAGWPECCGPGQALEKLFRLNDRGQPLLCESRLFCPFLDVLAGHFLVLLDTYRQPTFFRESRVSGLVQR